MKSAKVFHILKMRTIILRMKRKRFLRIEMVILIDLKA